MNWETIRNNQASFNIAVIISGRDSLQRLLEFLVDIAARVYYFKSNAFSYSYCITKCFRSHLAEIHTVR